MEENKGVPSSVSVTVAHELLLAGHRYLDVRTLQEFSQGHACGAINVPYMNRESSSGLSESPDFLEQVCSHFGEDEDIIVGCHVGVDLSKPPLIFLTQVSRKSKILPVALQSGPRRDFLHKTDSFPHPQIMS